MDKYTKIVATLGPSSDSVEIIQKLYDAGMNVARLNFSHGSYDYFTKIIKNIRKVSYNIAILLDTKGPEIRTGEIKGDKIILEDNQELIFTKEKVEGTLKKVYLNYEKLELVEPGCKILIDDGLIETLVLENDGTQVKVKVLNGGELGSKKTVSIWGHNVQIPFLSKKDKEDIIFGIKQGVDFIAASFVRTAEEVQELNDLLFENKGEKIKIISKIEHGEAVENLDEIIDKSNGIMVARGDLAVEIPAEKVPKIQTEIIYKCREHGKPVIVATQMLESMKDNPRPTRAEVSDVARAIMQGTDAIMLSGETAGGKYPVKSVEMMTKIAKEYDFFQRSDILENLHSDDEFAKNSISLFITKSAYLASKSLNAKVIFVPTVSGYTARKVSRFRPHTPVLAITHDLQVLRQLQLSWGIKSINSKTFYENKKEMLKLLKEKGKESNCIDSSDDIVIITSGHIFNKPGHTNLLEIFKVRDM